MNMLKTIICDDEPNARRLLKNLLARHFTDIEVCGEAASVQETVTALRSQKPDIVFLDVEMPDGTGFDALEQLEPFEFNVVFVTAYKQYAIQAFKASAVDYLLKPIESAELKDAVAKARRAIAAHKIIEKLGHWGENGALPGKVSVPDAHGFSLIEVADILFCEAVKNYTLIHLRNGTTVCSSRTLKVYEEMLTPHHFSRVHKSFLVNLGAVAKIVKTGSGYLVLDNGKQIEISRRRKETILQTLVWRSWPGNQSGPQISE